ncbi:MAG: VOC family protein [Minwuiales bacterium]|nr:VOC family protein [Minwuiales bacterium]
MTAGRIAALRLWTADPEAAAAFYQARLGMALLGTVPPAGDGGVGLHRLGFPAEPPEAPILELCHRPDAAGRIAPQGRDGESPVGYWKVGLTVRDIGRAYGGLADVGVRVGDPPHRFRDIARLCHLEDLDGYCIELIERSDDLPLPADRAAAAAPLGSPPVWSQITLRVKDPTASLAFYQDLLGMRLLARMPVPDYRFTLYFLAFTDETPPDPDLEALGNRDWLWNRPYVTLELQHRWGTEEDPGFAYHTGADDPLGFDHIAITLPDRDSLMQRVRRSEAAFLLDPDGYRISVRSDLAGP